MLVRTDSLHHLLEKEDMTSEIILETLWKTQGNVYSLLPPDCFREVLWAELPNASYAVVSYQWKQKWHSMVKFILHSRERVLQPYMWIDCKCLDQMDPIKMATIKRSDEIYYNAKEYHMIEAGSLFRGWVLFELSSVSEKMLPPKLHISTQDPAMIKMVKDRLIRTGFEGSEFTEEVDREVVKKKIIERYGTIANFNQRIVAIVDKIFV